MEEPFENSKLGFGLLPKQYISPERLAEMQARNRHMLDLEAKFNQEKETREEDNHLNLQAIKESTSETVQTLKETNAILKENNQLLKEKNEMLMSKLELICDVINQLADCYKESSENQEEAIKQALALVVQLNVTAEDNQKENWKDILTGTSAGTILLGLQVLLHQHGLI